MKLNKLSVILSVVALFLVGSAIIAVKLSHSGGEKTDNQNQECLVSIEEKIVQGYSLSGLIEDGQTIKAFIGYYDCHEIKRGDLILYSYAGSSDPLLKIVKAIPGDSFSLQNTAAGWSILINQEVLKNSENEPYALDERGHLMLSLYEHDYGGVIPANTYLIMGNLAGGSTDSSRFGLIDKNDILGRAEI